MTKCIKMGMIYAHRSLAHHNSTVIEDELQEIDRRMMMMMKKINREVIVTTIKNEVIDLIMRSLLLTLYPVISLEVTTFILTTTVRTVSLQIKSEFHLRTWKLL